MRGVRRASKFVVSIGDFIEMVACYDGDGYVGLVHGYGCSERWAILWIWVN